MGSIGGDSDLQHGAKTFPDVCQQYYWSCFYVQAHVREVWGEEEEEKEGEDYSRL